jgi:hypothetical protein
VKIHKQIPGGYYCYKWVPARGCGFVDIRAVNEHIATLPIDDQAAAHMKLTRSVRCPFWRRIGKGRVYCKFLKLTAVLITRRTEQLAETFYLHHPKARERDKGFLIGDAVKECDINPNFDDGA